VVPHSQHRPSYRLRRIQSDGTEILLANCLAHGRRQFVEVATNFPGEWFVEVATNFPGECRYVLEALTYIDTMRRRARGPTTNLSRGGVTQVRGAKCWQERPS
jgi:hypothetical protein